MKRGGPNSASVQRLRLLDRPRSQAITDDQKSDFDDRKPDDAADARLNQAPNQPPKDDRELCGRPQCAEEVPASVSFARR